MQEFLDTGEIAVAIARKPGNPSFERTTPKNYHAVKLDITDPCDIQPAFAKPYLISSPRRRDGQQ